MAYETTYPEGTAPEVKALVEQIHGRDKRVRIWIGDKTTGVAWPEEFGVTGYIGRSAGPNKIPLLVHNRHSLGGGALMTGVILRIDDTRTHRTLYQHPSWQQPEYEMDMKGDSKLPVRVHHVIQQDDETALTAHHASFATLGKAQRYIDFMTGKRYAK